MKSRRVALLIVAIASLSPRGVSAQPSRKYFYEDIFTPFFARDDAAGVYRAQRSGSSRIAEQSQFPIRKAPGTFRVFVIGGSIALRYMSGPDNLGAVLKDALPAKRVEVLNCGMGGYDSYREAMILEEVLDYEPDLIVLLTGHNERVGSPPVPLWTLHARDRVSRWTAYLDSVARYFKSGGEVFKFTPEEIARRDRAFKVNLRRMIERARQRGAAVAVALPPLNYLQSAPFMPQALTNPTTARGWLQYLKGETQAAAAFWRKALNDPATDAQEVAGLRYLQGLADEDRGDWDAARRDFSLAIDSDRGIGRCAQKCRDVIREVTRQEGGILVDLDGAFRRFSLPRAPGLDMFDDGVHWWYRYNLLATLEIVGALRGRQPFQSWEWDDDRMRSEGRRSLRRPEAPPEDETFATLRYALSEMDQPSFNWRAAAQLQAVYERFPRWFADPAAVLRRAEIGSDAHMRDMGMMPLKTSLPVFYWYLGEMRVRRREFARAVEDFNRALALDPGLQGALLGRSVAQYLSGDAAAARRGLHALREDHLLGAAAAALAEAMGFPDEEKLHAEALRVHDEEKHHEEASAYTRRDEAQRACARLRRLTQMYPEDPRYRVDLGVAAFTAGRLDESEEQLLAAVRLAPENLSAWSSLAAVYVAEGKPDLAAGVNKRVLSGICSRLPRQPQCSLFLEPAR